MATPDRSCGNCGEAFTLSPDKPGLVNVCPRCSAPPIQELIERKPLKRRQKTANEIVGDYERKMRRNKKLIDLIMPKGMRS
jgi:hypothetical protein